MNGHRSFGLCLVSLLVALIGRPATAGQLHVDRVGLSQVAEQGGRAFQVKVKTVREAEGNDAFLGFEVIRSWPEGKAEAGTELQARVYGGIVWDNPRRSPIDRRLRGALPARSIAVGQEVILVQEGSGLRDSGVLGAREPLSGSRVEALPVSESVLRRLGVFFDPGGRVRHARSPRPQLVADLGDAELAPLALRALEKRGGVKAPELLEVASLSTVQGVLEGMKPPARAAFLRAALPWARSHPTELKRFVGLCGSFLDGTVAPALVPLVLLADPTDAGGHQIYRSALLEAQTYLQEHPAAAGLAQAYGPVLLGWLERPESYEDRGKTLELFLKATKGKAKRALLRDLLARIPREEGMDFTALHQVTAQMVKSPDPAALELILAIEPFAADVLSSQERVFDQQVQMALAIAAKRPAVRARLARRFEPYRRYGLDLEPETLSAYIRLLGPAASALPDKKASRSESSEFLLAPGERGTDLAGYRVDFDREREGGFSFRVKARHHGGSGGKLGATGTWAVEGLETGRLFLLKRAEVAPDSRPRLKVTLLPAAEPAPDPRNQEALLPLALEAAQEAGCPAHGVPVFEEDSARLRLEARDAAGKGCTVVVGAYTGSITIER